MASERTAAIGRILNASTATVRSDVTIAPSGQTARRFEEKVHTRLKKIILGTLIEDSS
jgi:hypothetical protein